MGSASFGEIADWAASLPVPPAFLPCAYRAQLLVEACYKARLKIPEDIAILGVDNLETVCNHSVPTLSSINGNPEHIGWLAAALSIVS